MVCGKVSNAADDLMLLGMLDSSGRSLGPTSRPSKVWGHRHSAHVESALISNSFLVNA